MEHAFTKKNSIHPKDKVVSGSCENDESEGDSECDEDDDDQCDGGNLRGKLNNNLEVEAPPTPVEQVNPFLKR